MKKIEIQKNKNYITNTTNSKRQNYFIKNPKKILRPASNEKRFNNTAIFYNNPYLNNSNYKYDLKDNSKIEFYKTRVSTPKKIITKINNYQSKINRSRPQSTFVRNLPKLIKNNNNNNIFPSFSPSNYLTLEEEQLNQEKYQLNKIIKNLQQQLFSLKRDNIEKDELLNNKENEINKLITNNNILFDEDNKNYNDNIINDINNINNIIQNNSAYNLYLKIKKEIKNFNNEIKEEEEKIKQLKNSKYYTKTYECFIEKKLLEEQINKISSLINNALIVKENNAARRKEFYYFENKINLQKKILNELKLKQKYLNEDEDCLQKEIKNMKYNLIFNKDKVDKNKKDINLLIKKNNNLSNDKVIKTKTYIKDNDNNNTIPLNSVYLKKISELQKLVNFYKNQNKYNESLINKLTEQKKSSLESLHLSHRLKYTPSFLNFKLKNIQNEKEKNINNTNNNDKGDKNENDKNDNLVDDDKKINELRIIYENTKNEEKKLEEQYKQLKDKIKQINEYIQQQQNLNNANSANNEEETAQNQIEFGIDENNPYYTENEDNQPEINNKFTSTQFNQFTYILFKNFEAKGIVSEESKNKIIDPFIKFANDNKLEMAQYPSEQFNYIVEEFTKIILDSINCENNYNHSLTKIFVSALLFNSGCYVQKLIDYFNILFSYTRNYINEEEKYINKLRNKYKEQTEKLITCINSYIKNEYKINNDENKTFPIYFPLIKIKDIIESNNIILKDKYVEFLFYFLKKFNDNKAKLDELKYSLLNDILNINNEDNNKNNNIVKKSNTDPNITNTNNNEINKENIINDNKEVIINDIKKDNNDNDNNNDNNENYNNNDNIKDNNNNDNINDNNIIKEKEKNIINDNENININDNNNDTNINTDRKMENNSNMDESMTEITNEEYIKQLNDALKIIKNGLKKKNISFGEFINDIKQNVEVENRIVECFTIDNFNDILKGIGIIFSDLKLSCLCSKYSLPNELRLIEIKNIERDINLK